jgi:hypothetical protein
MFGIIGLWIIFILGGGAVMWFICPTPSVIGLPYYLKCITLFVVDLVMRWLVCFW